MFEKIIKIAEKEGLTAKECNMQSGYYWDGNDHVFIYPAITFLHDRSVSGITLSNFLLFLERIAKRYKLVKITFNLQPNHYYYAYTTQENAEKAREAYSKAVCFQEGLFLERYNNKNATSEQLIKAGHDSLVKHGYTV